MRVHNLSRMFVFGGAYEQMSNSGDTQITAK